MITTIILGLSGCSAATPEAVTPTPTALFASEDEAFAAAEATYRAYVDAFNEIDFTDPSEFESVYKWTSGVVNAEDRKVLSGAIAEGHVKSGRAEAVKIEPEEFSGIDTATPSVILRLCFDVSEVQIEAPDGNSATTAGRPDVYAFLATFLSSDNTSTGLVLSELDDGSSAIQC